uniref:TatD family hydrolase n=1 Tax=Acinetobacter nosocomialis TaxID=106654 RepID=UPI00208DF72F
RNELQTSSTHKQIIHELVNHHREQFTVTLTSILQESLATALKAHKFKLGGIAHAFSGGVEEAKGLIKLGFKIGVTGQVTNPN